MGGFFSRQNKQFVILKGPTRPDDEIEYCCRDVPERNTVAAARTSLLKALDETTKVKCKLYESLVFSRYERVAWCYDIVMQLH